MIKVTANKGTVDVYEVIGSGTQIMSELCCIVAAVCQGWSEDEDDSETIRVNMIEAIARTLLVTKGKLIGKKAD